LIHFYKRCDICKLRGDPGLAMGLFGNTKARILPLLKQCSKQWQPKETLINQQPKCSLASSSNFGLMFDIDGVIVRGRSVLPSAPKAFQMLWDEKTGDWRIPTIFITNASNSLRQDKADSLSKWLGIKIREEQVVMAHSPLKMFTEYHNKHVLVVGQGPVGKIANSLGFTKVTTMDELRFSFPALDACDHERRILAAKPVNDSFRRIEAILMFGESIRWETSLQLLLDVLMSNGHPYEPKESPEGRTHLPILACNMDLQWMAEAPMPRFGHGAFLLCLENLYKKVTGNDLVYTALVGKPSEVTYRIGEHVLQEEAMRIGSEVKTIYCIGDNVCTDIFGANLYNKYLQKQRNLKEGYGSISSRSLDSIVSWSGLNGAENCYSVLVDTGVFNDKERNSNSSLLEHSPRDFLPVEISFQEPTLACGNVFHAVQTIFETEKYQF